MEFHLVYQEMCIRDSYKSLGHVVQDLASAWALYSQAESQS